ncbi:MAG TPA: VOC family protein [Actinocrinis sp.]|jgi:hypothetical protein|uniref:VOC family protein n=1 Tax=Actinocrinis sp. TaxID=1920516 RepID=UPI002DDDA883|nr:VOC family protein [Actinocrinis sp.]HEV3172751.1 VOC family protein [Actinocrinis sp.]
MLSGIVIDALDVPAMERFWRAATQGRTDGLRLRFAATREPKSGKNRLHLDLAGGPDWKREVDRLLALGARRADIDQGQVPWDVLADPEGNEFCVLRPGHPGVLSDAGLSAICLDTAQEDLSAQAEFWQAQTGWPHVEHHPWGVRLRPSQTSPLSLVMGPPVASSTGRNRLRLEITDRDRDRNPGEFVDPAGNEFHITHG